MHLITNTHGDRLSITLVQTYRACLDGAGKVMADYYVAADGSVLSLKRRVPRLMSPAFSDGNLYVPMQMNGTTKAGFLHRLVALAWVGPPPSPDHRIFHLDRDKNNNAASNLRWALGTTDRPMISDEQIETVQQLRRGGKTFNQIADTVARTTAVVGDIVCGRRGFEGLGTEEGEVRGVRSSKLTSEDVDEIRKMYETGQLTQREVAAVFGIHHSAVSYIVRDKRWKKVA
jgi:hypothetical protein